MISRVGFWLKFKKLIFGCFAILFGAFTCCLLGSWTINEQGNLVGENILKDDLSNIILRRNDCTLNSYGNYSINMTINADNNSSGVYFTLNSLIDENQVISISFDIYSNDTILYATLGLEPNLSSVSINNNYYHYETSVNVVYNKAFVMYFYTSMNSIINISNIMINTGTTPLEWEPYGVWYSQNNYDIASTRYNSLYYLLFNNSYQYVYVDDNQYYGDGSIYTLYNVYKNGPNADMLHIYSVADQANAFNLFTWNTQFASEFFTNHPKGTMLFVPTNFITYNIYINLDDINFNYNIQALYLDNTYISINTDNLQPHLYLAKLESSFDNPIVAFSFDYYTEDYILSNQRVSIDSSGLNINDYYQRGYDSARASYGATIQQQQRDIDDLNTQIGNLNNTIDSWISRYNNLASQSTELSMRNLMWYIASTPFESFKSIWNVDFLGLNISAFFTGMFSIFIIIWILKKIF